MPLTRLLASLSAGALLVTTAAAADEAPRKLLLIAGPDSHGYGEHEHPATLRLLAGWINAAGAGVRAEVSEGWPAEAQTVAAADALVVFSDGGADSLVTRNRAALDAAAQRGAGLALLHYALVVPKGEPGRQATQWIGGYYETHWSVNPFWTARIERLPEHPVTRGVRPFAVRDEWYFHMRFREDMAGVQPLLEAAPPDAAREGPDGPYSGNPAVRARRGMKETLAWAVERPDGGRGFGFTGGHDLWLLAHDDYRRFLLNALVWLAGAPVPEGGVPSPRPTAAALMKAMAQPPPADWTEAKADARIRQALSPPDQP